MMYVFVVFRCRHYHALFLSLLVSLLLWVGVNPDF
jgi:hypothetical protein